MAWWDVIQKVLAPKPAAQGLPIFQYPALAAAKQATGGGANAYGLLVELLSDINNTSDAWVEGLELSAFDTGNTDYFVALSREAAGGAPVKVEAEMPTHSQTTVAADHIEILRFDPPVYFPAGTGIRFACADSAGGKKVSAWALVSRGRG